MPLQIEAIRADPVQAREWRVKFFTQGFGLAGSIALDEPITASMPFADDIDRVVERGGADCWQESRLQHLVDEPLAGDGDGGLFGSR
ncbi:hypothetical protein [Rhodopseudomonas faecalis]|uniref:hypothetical protein n=1 Tax=Rhodopseudomonas faecalis TaxID=99655 RepID=UPI0015E88D31|nr:hypothetical protein [Rhodopseudomonas faecalis]